MRSWELDLLPWASTLVSTVEMGYMEMSSLSARAVERLVLPPLDFLGVRFIDEEVSWMWFVTDSLEARMSMLVE